jgi:hypothetical protein
MCRGVFFPLFLPRCVKHCGLRRLIGRQGVLSGAWAASGLTASGPVYEFGSSLLGQLERNNA